MRNQPYISITQVLKISAFRNFWFGQVISQISLNMLVFVLAVIVYEASRSNTAVSLLYLTVSLPAAVFGLVSGVYVDRLPKRLLLVSSTLIRAFLILLVFLSFRSLPLIFLLVIAISLVSQFFVPAGAALIAKLVPPPQLLTANSLFTLTFYTAIIGGFVAGGPFLALLGQELVLLFLSGLFFVATVFLFFLPKDKQIKEVVIQTQISSLAKDLKELFSFVYVTPSVGQAIALLTVTQTIIAIIASLAPGFADRILEVNLTDSSVLILGPAALGMVFGALLSGALNVKISRRILVISGVFVSGVLLLFMAYLMHYSANEYLMSWFSQTFGLPLAKALLPVTVVSFFLLGFANSLIDVICNTVMQGRTHEALRGKVYGLLASLIGGVAIIPVVVSGVIADAFGIGKIIFALGVLLVILSLITFIRYRDPA